MTTKKQRDCIFLKDEKKSKMAKSKMAASVYVTQSGKMRRKSRFAVLELLPELKSPQNYL